MNFRRDMREDPELNLIPMIDVLIVLLIFLFLTTTFDRQRGLTVHLPHAAGAASLPRDPPIRLIISADGHYDIAGEKIEPNRPDTLPRALKKAAGDRMDPLLVIEADESSRHQSLVSLLDAAERLGFRRISFAARSPASTSP